MDTSNSVVGRVAALLRAVSTNEPEGSTASALARDVSQARPTVHRILSSLCNEGIIDRDLSGRWHLGPELFLLGTAAAERYDVRAIAQPFVRRLAEQTGESAFFSVARGDETVCLLREDGAFPIRSHVLHEGVRFPLGVVSAGLAVLAFMPRREIDQFLESHDLAATYGPSHDVDSIRHRLDQARSTGWSLNPGLIVPGSWGMAAAVFRGDRPTGALTLTGIEARFSAKRQPEMGAALLKAAHSLSSALRSRQV